MKDVDQPVHDHSICYAEPYVVARYAKSWKEHGGHRVYFRTGKISCHVWNLIHA